MNFTGFNQYVDPTVHHLNAPGLNRTGRIVRARVRLVSRQVPPAACSSTSASGLTGAGRLGLRRGGYRPASLRWGCGGTITLDTGVVAPADGRRFDTAVIVQIGIQITTGIAFDGGMPSDEVVFEIDTGPGLIRRRAANTKPGRHGRPGSSLLSNS